MDSIHKESEKEKKIAESPTSAPNIILITTHDMGIHIGCYDDQYPTPNLDRLASRGVRFVNNFCSAPQCSPSRGSILTGKMPSSNGLMGLTNRGWDLSEKNMTIPKYLKQHGYSTHLIGLQHVHKEAKRIGYDTVSSRYEVPFAGNVAKRFAKYLRLVDKGQIPQPFYLDVGFVEAHRPFFKGIFKHPPTKECVPPPYLVADAGTKNELAIFAQKVTSVDNAIGKIMELVDKSNIKKNTLIIFTTDHGWAFPRAKGTLYDEGLRTCLIISWPGHLKGGEVYSDLISNIDLFPTIAEITENPLPDEIQKEIQGQSYFPLISKLASSDNTQLRNEIYAEMTFHDQGYNPMRAVRTKKWKYIQNFSDCNGTQFQIPLDFNNVSSGKAYKKAHPEYFTPRPTEELYNVEEDPNEFKNLASDPKYKVILQELRQKVDANMHRTRDPLLQGKVEEVPKKTRLII